MHLCAIRHNALLPCFGLESLIVELGPEAEDTIQITLNNEATLLAVLGENFLMAFRLGRDSAHRVVVERSITLCVGSNRPILISPSYNNTTRANNQTTEEIVREV